MKGAIALMVLAVMVWGAGNALALTEEELRLEMAFQVLNLADFAVTEKALDYGAVERNPVIGDRPSDERLLYSAVVFGLVHYGITELMPPKYRDFWLWGSAISKGLVTGKNLLVVEW